MARIETGFVLLAAMTATLGAAAFAADLYVSLDGIHSVEGSDLGWGTYRTDDGVFHDAYTNLQQAVNAAAKDDTVWVEDGFVCDDSQGEVVFNGSGANASYGRLNIPRNMTVRSRSGKWETGAVIRGRWQCDYDGTGTAATGANAVRGVQGQGRTGTKLIGFRIERCSMNGFQNGNAALNIALENCMVSGCSASYNTVNNAQLNHCVISNCYAGSYAQIFQNANAYDCLFIKNSGSAHAGYLTDGNVLSNCVFTLNANNCACMTGTSETNPARIIDCVFTNNTGVSIGSQYSGKYRCVISNCLFTANTGSVFAPMYGFSNGRTNDDIRVYNCIVTNNSPSANVIYSAGAYYNCLIANNTCANGNAAVVHNPDVTTPLRLYNCTIYGNTAANGWGGVHGAGEIIAVNTIVRENTSKKGNADAFTATTNCCLEPDAAPGTAEENITDDPMLFAPESSVYTPIEMSPCYAGGSLTAYELTETDLAGRPRLTDGHVAIGAYEYNPNYHALVADVVFPPYLTAPAVVEYSVRASGLGFAPVYYWDYDGDGVTDEVATSPRHVHAFDSGTWPVILIVSNLVAGTSDSTALDPFTVIARPTLYVKEGNAGEQAPYDTEENAAAAIQTAVDACADGGEVIILPGVYALTNAVTVFKDITVRGSTGNPEDVVLRMTGSDRCLWVNGGDHTIVHSLAVENGKRDMTFEYGSSVFLAGGDHPVGKPSDNYTTTAAKGCVSNLVVRNGQNTCKFAVAPGIYACGEDALVTHCVVSNCHSSSCYIDGGSFSGLGLHLVNGARAENCLVTDNWSGSPYNGKPSDALLTNGWHNSNFQSAVFVGKDSKLRFTTVVGNRASYCGGVNVVDSGRVEGCVIAGNTALCNFLKNHHPEADRLNVWSAFPAGPGYCFYRGPSATDEQKAECWTSFTNIVAAEVRTAADKAAQLTVNAVDVAYDGLGEGTVVATPDELFRNAAKGDWRLRAGSPARDVLPRDFAPDASAADLMGGPRYFGGAFDLGCFEWFTGGTVMILR